MTDDERKALGVPLASAGLERISVTIDKLIADIAARRADVERRGHGAPAGPRPPGSPHDPPDGADGLGEGEGPEVAEGSPPDRPAAPPEPAPPAKEPGLE